MTTLEPLARAGKMGPVLFQLPPNFKLDLTVLEEFLVMLPKGVRAAFEFRHDSWFADDAFALLRKYNRAICVAESEERTTPDVVTADFCYYRYRKPEYAPDERHAMVGRIGEHLQQERDVYGFFKHEETPQGALYAVEILRQFNPNYQPLVSK
jgi:uncharacterized protein YecE (DUF72 family)